MLQLAGEPFTTGVLTYRDNDPDRIRKQASIYIPVNIPLPSGQITVLAFLDTGAPYLIVGRDEIEVLGLKSASVTAQISMKTRIGEIKGFLDKVDLMIPAENGDSLRFQVTVFASDKWTEGIFLGYDGCMSNINFAVQPQQNQFFFGPP